MKNMESAPVRQPDRVLSYFENQRPVLAVVTVSGLIYNLGLVVGPWFEGQLAQCLLGILNGNETFAAMAALCAQVCQQHQPQHETGTVRQSGAERQG